MKLAARTSIIFILSLVFSCQRYERMVVLWKCDNSVLYLNSLDSCIKVPGLLSDYAMSVSIRHHDNFSMNGLRFALEISTSGDTIYDTLFMPLSDSLGTWNGTPHIGAYVKKIPLGISLPSSDSAKFSIMPLMSDARDGVDWLAFEFEKK